MSLQAEERRRLYAQAKQLRIDIVNVTADSGGAHIGGGLSAADILTALYFKFLSIKPEDPDWEERDRFVLSKGHAAIAFAPVLARRGFYSFDLLASFNKFRSPFGMHPDSKRIPGCDASTGSLGHGLPMAVGMALGGRVLGTAFRTYCLLGDGECNEGVVWEAFMAAAHYKLTTLIPIIDRNRLMIDGPTEEVMGIEPLAEKLASFGLEVLSVDGHDMDELCGALETAREAKGKPVVIIAQTVKGKGIDFMENQVPWHYGSIDSSMRARALESVERMYRELEEVPS